MDISTLITLQFIAHLLTDYIFQSEKQVEDLNEKGFKSKFLPQHFLIAFICSWVLSFQLLFVVAAIVIAAIHVIIDGLKKYLDKDRKIGKYSFYISQLLHLLILIIVSLLFEKTTPLIDFYEMKFDWYIVLLIAGYLFCLKPANILIKQIFKSYSITDQTNDDLQRAGRLIGSLERILALTFVILSQYEALGFLIAAKSILRFKDGATRKTEYVLIGTMLSFGIAIGTGILILHLK
ncbi:DUF3307 domain-containing protein [Brumimicrobium glaciale]|uniref:DUF3307 domain-containing protein n=1 Tax=Brumimicrobium glaciale TaxID=200475 RepID=A0A4Q4KQ31_9FLAO|nr:DUF3307 domain-containing protein [Brumimicrobium glaciale]RYM34987.1 DUF3307 domain-containing protein [Brumimicrobium glaciale]